MKLQGVPAAGASVRTVLSPWPGRHRPSRPARGFLYVAAFDLLLSPHHVPSQALNPSETEGSRQPQEAPPYCLP